MKQLRAAQEPGEFTDIMLLKAEDEEAAPGEGTLQEVMGDNEHA
jgi:hypothetical protein